MTIISSDFYVVIIFVSQQFAKILQSVSVFLVLVLPKKSELWKNNNKKTGSCNTIQVSQQSCQENVLCSFEFSNNKSKISNVDIAIYCYPATSFGLVLSIFMYGQHDCWVDQAFGKNRKKISRKIKRKSVRTSKCG